MPDLESLQAELADLRTEVEELRTLVMSQLKISDIEHHYGRKFQAEDLKSLVQGDLASRLHMSNLMFTPPELEE